MPDTVQTKVKKNINFFDFFEAIYCINLKNRPDKWSNAEKEFEKIGIKGKVVRFDAIEVKENGHIGCMLSHRAIIKMSQEKKLKNVLVFEDDIVFTGTMEDLNDFLGFSNKNNWDLLYFGGQCPFAEVPIIRSIRNTNIFKCIGVKGTHAIAYNETIFNKIILEGYPEHKIIKILTPIDAFLSRNLQKNSISLIYGKPLIITKPGKSDIGKIYVDMNKLIVDNFYFWKVLHTFRFISKSIEFLRPLFLIIIQIILTINKKETPNDVQKYN